jgi:hypothetical protein
MVMILFKEQFVPVPPAVLQYGTVYLQYEYRRRGARNLVFREKFGECVVVGALDDFAKKVPPNLLYHTIATCTVRRTSYSTRM